MNSNQLPSISGRPWALVRILPDALYVTVARFANRSDAEDSLRAIRRFLPEANLEIVFDISADPNYWEQQYQEQDTPWDIGIAAPAFRTLLSSPEKPSPGRALVPGCGYGLNALLFAEFGFDVVGVDFAPSAIAAAKYLAQTATGKVEFLQRNIFDLANEFSGHFDYVIEYMCFCAIPPDSRWQYVQLVKSLLRPKGELIGIFFIDKRRSGPPFGATPAEICRYFEGDFELLYFEPVTNSVPSRQGREYLGRFRRR